MIILTDKHLQVAVTAEELRVILDALVSWKGPYTKSDILTENERGPVAKQVKLAEHMAYELSKFLSTS